MELDIYTDGGSRGNPGPAGIGVVIKRRADGVPLANVHRYLGITTNNQAEYQAVIAALEKAKTLGGTDLHFFLDSQLVAEQLSGNYRVKDKGLQQLYVRAHNLRLQFSRSTFTYIPRERNFEADALANKAMDEGTAKAL